MSNTFKPKLILFDWDGTLVDSFAFLEAAHNNALRLFKMPERPKNWFSIYFGKPRDFIYQDIYAERGDEARGHFETFVRENHKTLLQPMVGAQDMLEKLQTLNVNMGVVSNKRSEFIHKEVTHLGWDIYFKSVIGAGDAKADKPSADPVYEALRQSGLGGLSMEDVLYVGDTDVDMKTAHNAKCPYILMNANEPTIDWITDEKPLKIAKNCEELLNYLLQYYQN